MDSEQAFILVTLTSTLYQQIIIDSMTKSQNAVVSDMKYSGQELMIKEYFV